MIVVVCFCVCLSVLGVQANKKLVTQEARLKEIEEEKAKKTEEVPSLSASTFHCGTLDVTLFVVQSV